MTADEREVLRLLCKRVANHNPMWAQFFDTDDRDKLRAYSESPAQPEAQPRPAVTVEEIRDKLCAAMPQSCRLQCTGEEVALRLARVAFEMMGGGA